MKLRALIVDDEPLSRERIRMLLAEHPDVEIVDECGDGTSAVALIQQHKPDLVLLDVQMPELDGFDVLEQISPAVMPGVIFVTAYDSYAIRAFDVNAVDYLLKPVDPARLSVALERARSGAGREGTTDRLLSAVESFKRPRYRTRVVVREIGRASCRERVWIWV